MDRYYEACDKAISAMNKENVEAFGRLKLADWDQVNVIRTVVTVYRTSVRKARKRYLKVARYGYLYGMYLCGLDKDQREAEKAITEKWVDRVLTETDFVTLYRFNSEAERKAYKLAETLEVSPDRNREIDKALRYWSQQLGQFAINMTDYAILQAFEDAGVEEVIWDTVKDERRCHACREIDGKRFNVDEVPPKPHMGCRCHLIPVVDE